MARSMLVQNVQYLMTTLYEGCDLDYAQHTELTEELTTLLAYWDMVVPNEAVHYTNAPKQDNSAIKDYVDNFYNYIFSMTQEV